MARNRKYLITYTIAGITLVFLFLANLVAGPVKIPITDALLILFGKLSTQQSWNQIILGARLPQAVTALLGGAALAVSGLQLQTLFSNPLAGPSILGISDGANLGVALAMLYISTTNYITIIFAAFFGAAVVLAIIIWFSHKVQNNVMLLIIGIMVGYIASSLISILNFNASADKVHQYVMWGMGDFGSVSMDKLPWYVSFCVAGLAGALLLVKPLNALLLGDSYAANLGINVKRSRLAILLTTSLLTATVTAFCGPISFIGLAVPHIARLFLNRSDHRHLLPVTILVGSVISLLCNLLANISTSGGSLPLNAITSIVGAPVIIYVIMSRKRLHYFN